MLAGRGQVGGGTLWKGRSSRETDVDVVGSAEIDRTEATGAESDQGSGVVVGVHCACGALQVAARDLCEILQHPQTEKAEMARHDATPKPKCQLLMAEPGLRTNWSQLG